MIVHKSYGCEYCGEEFDEEAECFVHEQNCEYKPDSKKCASCGYGEIRISYEVPHVKCGRPMRIGDSCGCWKAKK